MSESFESAQTTGNYQEIYRLMRQQIGSLPEGMPTREDAIRALDSIAPENISGEMRQTIIDGFMRDETSAADAADAAADQLAA